MKDVSNDIHQEELLAIQSSDSFNILRWKSMQGIASSNETYAIFGALKPCLHKAFNPDSNLIQVFKCANPDCIPGYCGCVLNLDYTLD